MNKSIHEFTQRLGNFGKYCGYVLYLLPLMSQAVVFEVTTSEEFQSALSAASNNDSDNEILLQPGTYEGNFAYVFKTPNKLEIRGVSSDKRDVLIDGGGRAYTLFINAKAGGDFELSSVTVSGGASLEGASTVPVRGVLSSLSIDSSSISGAVSFSSGLPIDLRATAIEIKNSEIVGLSSPGNEARLPASQKLSIQGSTLRKVGLNIEARDISVLDSEIMNSQINVQMRRMGDDQFGEYIVSRNNIWDSVTKFMAYEEGRIGDEEIIFENNQVRNSSLSLYGPRFFVVANQILDTYFLNSTIDSKISANLLHSSVSGCDNTLRGSEQHRGVIYSDGASGGLWHANQIVDLRQVWIGAHQIESNLISSTHNPISITLSSVGDANSFNKVTNNTLAHNCRNVAVSIDETTNLQFSNNIVWANSKLGGYDGESPADSLFFTGYGENLIATNNIIESTNAIWTTEENTLKKDPMFFSPDNIDLHVTLDSPAIDAGNNAIVDRGTDADGNQRVIGGIVDIGAFERSTSDLHPADSDADGSISSKEFESYNQAWRNNESWSTEPRSIPVDYVTRAGYLLQKGGAYKNIGVGKPATWVPVNE